MLMTFAKVSIYARIIVTFISQQLWYSILNYYCLHFLIFFISLGFVFLSNEASFPNLAQIAHFKR